MPSRILLLLALLSAVTVRAQPLKFPRIPPIEPADAPRSFEALDGFRLELLAHEPNLASPVVLEYDEHGSAWVLEMRDYPFTDKTTDKPFVDKSTDKPLGRVRVLKDADGDGRFESSTIFADDLSWPTGLAFWKGGVFVIATPDLWYLKDTDGDGRADVREKLYSGFRKFNIQSVPNNLRWGLDHQIYGSGGTNGGAIQSVKNPQTPPIAMSANDFRLDPREKSFTLLSGGVRFGHSFDDWGHRFLCNIRNPVIHVVLPSEYLARNPFASFKTPLHDAAETGDTLPVYRISPSEAWRTLRAQRWVTDLEGKLFPRSELVPDAYFTSAAGITIYRGSAYPAKYYGNAFLADVAGNLVHRQTLEPAGVTFTARRADDKTEFVRSKDIWFRPVNFVNAPDGTLHIVDMYRETIEHPWSIPDDIKAALDLESGRDRGRIWRLTPPNFTPSPPPRLGQASTAELVALLEHPNSWQRDTAHRLLFERQDKEAVAPLRELMEQSVRPLARLHALWSLHGLNALEDADLLRALSDAVPGVREHAVKLSEPRLPNSEAILTRVLALAVDPDMGVRFQVAFTLGGLDGNLATSALAQIARLPNDQYVRAAILSSSANRSHDLLTLLTADAAFTNLVESRPMLRQLAQVVGARGKSEELGSVVRALLTSPTTAESRPWKSEVLCGLGEGVRRSGKNLSVVLTSVNPAAVTLVDELLANAKRSAIDAGLPIDQREQAVQMLGYGDFASVREPLIAALESRQPPVLQLAAVRTLSFFPEPDLPAILLANWRGYTPALRAEVVEALLSRTERITPLLDEIESERIAVVAIPSARRLLLTRHADEKIRNRAKALFAAAAPGPRQDVLKAYASALELKPDPAKGKLVFEKVCATCHRLGELGVEVGPNLETVRHHAPLQLLTNVLDPNREVSPAFVEYVLLTKSGQTSSGLIATETATSVTLRRANNVQETLLRQDVEEFSSTGKSLMPEGLERNVSLQEMADLLSFIGMKGK